MDQKKKKILIVLFNLVWWSYQVNTRCLAVNNQKAQFVICDEPVNKKSRILFFSPESPIPLFVYTDLPYTAKSLTFLQDDQKYDLFFKTSEKSF